LYLAGQLVSLVGTWTQSVAQTWLVYRLTGSALWLGIATFCQQAPVFFLATLVGVLADRHRRRTLLVVTQSSAMALAFALAIVYTIIRVRGLSSHSKRMSRAQYEYLNVLWLVFGITAVASSAAFNIFSGWSAAALWTIAAAIVTAYIAIHGNRRAAVGAVILIASLVAASFMPHVPGYVLAAGMLVGYSGFGLATMLARD